MLIVFTTTSDKKEAEVLAEQIVAGNLAACVQILPSVTSVYIWKGDLVKESEQLLLIKTINEKYFELEEFIRHNHSYETPEIIAVQSDSASKDYLEWVKANVV